MSKYELSGTGLPVYDCESDGLELFDGDGTGMCSLLEKAGAVGADEYVVHCLQDPYDPGSSDPYGLNEYQRGKIERYREKSGRQFPLLYRIKITVEAEPLTEAENDAAWAARQQRE